MVTGRPPFSEEETAAAKELYLSLLSIGKTEREMDAVEALPGHSHRTHWKDDPAFLEQCKRARALGAEHKLQHANDKLDYAWERAIEDSCNPQLVSLAESYMKHARWLASKHNRDVYGEKVSQELTGKDGGPVQIADIVQACRQRAKPTS